MRNIHDTTKTPRTLSHDKRSHDSDCGHYMSCFLLNSFRLYALTAAGRLQRENMEKESVAQVWAGMHSWWRRAASSHPSLGAWGVCFLSFLCTRAWHC